MLGAQDLNQFDGNLDTDANNLGNINVGGGGGGGNGNGGGGGGGGNGGGGNNSSGGGSGGRGNFKNNRNFGGNNQVSDTFLLLLLFCFNKTKSNFFVRTKQYLKYITLI